ncbi:MAG: PAS domain-containing protein [Bacteroidia bacterium]
MTHTTNSRKDEQWYRLLIENTLNKSAEHRKIVLSASLRGCYDWYPMEDLIHWDEPMHNIFGIPLDFEANRNEYFLSVLHPEDKQRLQQEINQILKQDVSNKTFNLEYRIILSGQVRNIQSSGFLLHDSSGTIYRIMGTCEDITERLETIQILQDRETFLQTIFDQSLNAVMVADDEGNYLSVNPASAQLFGYPIEQLSRMNVSELKTTNIKDSKTQYHEFLEKGKEIGEFSFTRPDGEFRIAQYYAIRIGKDFNLSILADITERIFAETQLKKTKIELAEITERFQLSTHAAGVGIWDWNIQTDYLFWDEMMFTLYGIQKEDFKNTAESWIEKIHPDDISLAQQEITLALKGEKAYNTEFRVIWPDQSIHYIKSLATVQRDELGKEIRMLGTNWDITQEKEAEKQKIKARQLELKNKELEQFAYIASHDLKEPLRTIMSFTGLLKIRLGTNLDPEINELLGFIYHAGEKMEKLIKGLLEYSYIGMNKNLIDIDLNILVQQVINSLSVQISSTNTVLEIHHLPVVKGYETELFVIFQNLISNAIKFRHQEIPPIIRISAKKETDEWEISISDNGIGIEPEYQKKIFVIFQRLHTDSEYEGSGIGLAHCQKIAHLHGGKIWVESEYGKGSTFYFTISDFIGN